MALGRKIAEWNFEDIAKGMSTSGDLADGGFSPETDHVNPIAEYGVAHHPAQGTDKSTNLVGEMIASTEDPTGTYSRLYVSADSGQDGRFFSMDSSFALTLRGSEDTSNNYIQGKTDMMAFDGEAYITTNSTVVRWSSIGAANTFNTSFFTFANAFAPHPTLNYNNFGYYGDGNLLKRQSGAGVAPVTILTLPTGWVIVTLGIDPGSGLMLISVIGQLNLSGTINSGAKVIFYNGSSTTYSRIVQVDDMVTAFPATEGALYASYGQNFGLWNGSGITFLRRMNVAFDSDQLMYKNHFTSIGSTLYIIEKHKIIAYGPVRQKGDNVFYPALTNTPGGTPTNLTHIANVGTNVLSYSYFDSKFFVWDSLSFSTSATQDLLTNFYYFDNEYWVRWIRIIWKTQVGSNVDPGSLRIINEDGVITAVNPTVGGIVDLRNTSGAASAYKDLNNINVKVKQMKVEMIGDSINPGIRRIIVYGEIADRPN